MAGSSTTTRTTSRKPRLRDSPATQILTPVRSMQTLQYALPRNDSFDLPPGIFFSKDRKEEVIEVEEEPESVYMAEIKQEVKLMTQGQWMKGCPEGSEQSFLFSLYTQLSDGSCPCPNECGRSVPRKKADFFALMVSCVYVRCSDRQSNLLRDAYSPLSRRIFSISARP